MSDKFIRVTSHIEGSSKVFTDASDRIVAMVLQGGTVVDLRETAPYLPMSPCPYCRAVEDRNHIATQHIDPTLGTWV